jgi:hypothetical protein
VVIKPHPTAPDVVALLSRRRLCSGQSSACVRQDVWVSTDFARTWQSSLQRSAAGGSAIAGFIDFDWAPETQALPAGGGLPSAALLATAYLSADDQLHGVYWSGYWDKRVHLVVSRDYFTSHTLVRRCGNDFRVMSDGRVFLGVAGNCDGPASATDGWSVTLEVSRNSGGAWSTACFPSFEAEHGYTLYDMGGEVFVNVDHSDTRDPVKAGSPLGVLYHADAEGRLFSLSRRDVLLQPNGVSDFMPAGGLSGVAMANSVDGALWTDPAFLTGSKTAYDAVLSGISRDAGSNWVPLPTPAPLAGQPACSSGACALHVHGPDAAWRANISYPGLYASSGTPGVLWSTGSVGQHLSYEPAEVRTFLSLDGGASWATVAPNAHTYESAAFGSLLVMAPSGPSGATTEVHYSLDGGLCWGSVQLAQPMQVHNIQTRADNGGQVLLCHGLLPQQSLQLGVYVLDFSSLLARANVPTCGASDFEAWAPASCQRGSASILTRRKARARCLPATDWVPPPPSSRPCGCSDADYECSYGYERAPGGACVKMPDFSIDPGCPDGEWPVFAIAARLWVLTRVRYPFCKPQRLRPRRASSPAMHAPAVRRVVMAVVADGHASAGRLASWCSSSSSSSWPASPPPRSASRASSACPCHRRCGMVLTTPCPPCRAATLASKASGAASGSPPRRPRRTRGSTAPPRSPLSRARTCRRAAERIRL